MLAHLPLTDTFELSTVLFAPLLIILCIKLFFDPSDEGVKETEEHEEETEVSELTVAMRVLKYPLEPNANFHFYI